MIEFAAVSPAKLKKQSFAIHKAVRIRLWALLWAQINRTFFSTS
jgi:hypothetical protein